jgi:hypothetical protein
MVFSLSQWITGKISNWLNYETEGSPYTPSLTNFDRLCSEIQPGDVILLEGRSRVSGIIKLLTQSAWTHSALYIGNYDQLRTAGIAPDSLAHFADAPYTDLILEALIGEGTIVTPLSKYRKEHLRICRPRTITDNDCIRVIKHTLGKIGYQYNIRQLFDLARFLLPYNLIPRRWRSSLFHFYAGELTQTICSSMLAEAFISINYPVLPIVAQTKNGLRFYKRNIKLATPKDFDYSPYFEIIKFPFIALDKVAAYRELPWDENGYVCNEQGDCFIPDTNSETLPTDARGE